ncbi:MAG: PSD1 domain-containing protein [Acidobacteria bacterium]|nr:PSD1 domain-containing protein [Acidobacteriota bacterium]
MKTSLLILLMLPALSSGQNASLTEAQKEFFETRIRPVLAQQCFACHTNSKMAGLRLDSLQDMLKGGKSGAAIVPGDPDKSLLISAIRQTGKLAMPKGAVRLTDPQVADLTQWVKDGAFWPVEAPARTAAMTASQRRFWAIQPLSNPQPPKVKDAAWPLNDLDRFVLARLEKEELKPAPLADKRTLLRRVTYDLTGLPPTFEEVKAFEADKSPNAYEKVIDRLLASPRYGETWARHWMDVVRYGEDDYNVGARPDRTEKYPHAYHYRDWLINAINDDMPFDTFIKAQLAADLMEEKLRAKMTPALGMHGTGVWKFEDNPAPIERADEWHDKVDVTTKAFLGLTVGCARCHDHKYDPIPTKDYYRLAGVFASSRFHAYPMVPKAVVDDYDKQKKELEEKEAALKKFQEGASELYAQVLFAQTVDYMVAAWKVGSEKRATVAGIAEKEKLDAEILERWARFLKKKPFNYPYLKNWQEMVARGGSAIEAKELAQAFYKRIETVNKEYLKTKANNEIELAKLKNADEQFDPLPNGKKRRLNKHQIELKGLDREMTYLWRDVFQTDLPENPGNPNAEDAKKPGLLKLEGWLLEKRLSSDLTAHAARLKAGIEAFKKAMPPHYPFVYGIEEAKEVTDLKVFVRGNPYSFGDEAPRAFLSMLSPGEPEPFRNGSGRMELADAIIKHPITARVIVNRLWNWHMGSAIVDTPNNFGIYGGRPSNPELLEYLASRFVAGGMSWKKLHKEILLSRTYRLSSANLDSAIAKDPANRLYWRANRKRLEVESIWDSLLTVSGKLDTSKIGGPSEELGDKKMTRRAVYAKVSRMYPNELQTTFDFPAATISIERRYTTNVPQQRLFFLNNEVVHTQAESLAERLRGVAGEEEQVRKAYGIVYQRLPSPDEMTAALELLRAKPVEPAPPAMPSAGRAAAMKPDAPAFSIENASETAKAEPSKFKDSPLRSFCWALLSSNEFLYLN